MDGMKQVLRWTTVAGAVVVVAIIVLPLMYPDDACKIAAVVAWISILGVVVLVEFILPQVEL